MLREAEGTMVSAPPADPSRRMAHSTHVERKPTLGGNDGHHMLHAQAEAQTQLAICQGTFALPLRSNCLP